MLVFTFVGSAENLILVFTTKRWLPLLTGSFKANRRCRCTNVKFNHGSIKWVFYRLQHKFSSCNCCHKAVKCHKLRNWFYQIGHCRNPRIGLEIVSRSRPPLFLEFGTLRIVVSLTSCCELRNMPIMERIDLFVWSDWQLVVRRMVVSIVGSEVGGPRLSTR